LSQDIFGEEVLERGGVEDEEEVVDCSSPESDMMIKFQLFTSYMLILYSELNLQTNSF